MMHTIEVLDRSGHLSLTWDPDIDESVNRAYADFLALKEAGYEFFRVLPPNQAAVFDPHYGALVARHITTEEAAPKLTAPVPALAPQHAAKRRGRPPKVRAVAEPTETEPKERTVAIRPQRGG